MSKFFDFGLYKESIRQTRLMGIILGIVILGISMIGAIESMMIHNWRVTAGFERNVRTLSFMEFAPVLWIFMYLAPLLLVMKLFSFMNKRRASDFYHAIPHTRKSLFISFLAGIFTWIIGTMIVVTLLSTIVHVISPAVIFSTPILVYSFLGFLAGTLLVTSGILLAKGLSGTWLSNLAVAAIILFYPRFILMIFNDMFMSITRIIHPGDTNLLTNASYNIAFSVFDINHSIMWHGWPWDATNASMVGSVVYTFVLGLIYLLLAGMLFCRRKSEVAGRGATNRIVQHVIRCMLVFPITLVIPSVILSPFRGATWHSGDTIGIVVAVFMALVVYFVYELIVTKRLINVVKAIPALGIVILFNVLFIFLLVVSRNGVWNNVPVADEIAGVRIITRIHSSSSYNEILTHDLYINNPRINEMVEEIFRENVQRARRRTAEDIRFFGSDRGIGISIQMEDGSTMMRNLRFEGDLWDVFRSLRFLNEVYSEKATRLPVIDEDTSLSLTVSEWDLEWLSTGPGWGELEYWVAEHWPIEYVETNEVWDEVQDQVWEVYTREFNEMSVLEQAYHVGMIGSQDENIITVLGSIIVRGTVEQRSFVSSYRLSNLTPNTVEFLMKVINEAGESEMKTFVHSILEDVSSFGGSCDVHFEIVLQEIMREGDNAEVFRFWFCKDCREYHRENTRGEDELEELSEILRVIMEDSFGVAPRIDENLYQLRILENRDVSVVVFINITEENRSRINEILSEEETDR